MSCDVASATSIKMLILCLLTLGSISGDIKYRYNHVLRFLVCDEWVLINWFIWVLMLVMSFVVAVPISHLRAYPWKGGKLLLWQMCDCDCPLKEGLVCNKSIADIIVVLQELSMSSPYVWWVPLAALIAVESVLMVAGLGNILIVVFWQVVYYKISNWCSRYPRETCAIMIQEWCVGYACRTGWKIIDSPNSFPNEFVVG